MSAAGAFRVEDVDEVGLVAVVVTPDALDAGGVVRLTLAGRGALLGRDRRALAGLGALGRGGECCGCGLVARYLALAAANEHQQDHGERDR